MSLTLTNRALAPLLVAAMLLVILVPAPLYAWTPGTHVFLGDALLRNLTLIPPHLAELLAAFPSSFFVRLDRRGHEYRQKIRRCRTALSLVAHRIGDSRAGADALPSRVCDWLSRASCCGCGRAQFFCSATVSGHVEYDGHWHSYWESRIDTHIGELWPRRARELLVLDHAAADQHLDGILSPTLFGTATNRRIFRGMVYVTDTDSWQRIFQLVSENSRWDLSDADVGRYLARSFDYVVDLLNRWDASEPFDYDPSGDAPLREAKKVRRAARRQGGDIRAALEADRMFGMPVTPLRFAHQLPTPLFQPTRDDKS